MSLELYKQYFDAPGFIERVNANQRKLASKLEPSYDFIVCGSGSSGSVVACRLAENPAVSVLLLEAGGDDNVPGVMDPSQWILNIGTERDWQFKAEPNRWLNGRILPLAMGKVLGGGSSINGMLWARGHKSDWNFFASRKLEIRNGATTRYWRSIVASRIGRALQIQNIAEQADPYLFNPCLIRVPSPVPFSKEQDRPAFPDLRIKTGG